MVYKIQNAKDLNTLPLIEEKLKELICYYTEGLSNPKDDTEDSGFILYATPNTAHREIKALFDYTKHTLEYAELYDNIEMFNNQVRYKLKDGQHKLETKGLTKEQLKAKFDKQIDDAKADMARIQALYEEMHLVGKHPEMYITH